MVFIIKFILDKLDSGLISTETQTSFVEQQFPYEFNFTFDHSIWKMMFNSNKPGGKLFANFLNKRGKPTILHVVGNPDRYNIYKNDHNLPDNLINKFFLMAIEQGRIALGNRLMYVNEEDLDFAYDEYYKLKEEAIKIWDKTKLKNEG